MNKKIYYLQWPNIRKGQIDRNEDRNRFQCVYRETKAIYALAKWQMEIVIKCSVGVIGT